MSKKLTQSEAGKLGAIQSAITTAKKKQGRINKYNLNPTKCQECNKSFSYEKRNNKFCDRSCSASFNNRGNVKNGTPKPKEKICKTCNEIFPFTRQSRNTTHCPKCIKEVNYKITIKNAKNIDELHSDKSRRLYLINKHSNKCFVCKNTTWNNVPIPIELDHIDGNSENNIEENLRLICPNCHALTNTYKNKNKGKGRAKRMKRYNDGKSY